MPAITVPDLTVLPRVPLPDPERSTERPVRGVTSAPSGYEGEGFPVRRAFAGVDLADLDPFIHMDQMGEVEYAPGEPKGTPWHPHRGFETVTYLLDGIFDHHDSHGGGGTISDGDTQWMTAGSGLLHIEAPPESLVVSGGLFHGVQALGEPAEGQQVGDAALPGPARQPGRAAHQRRRRLAGAGHRRRGRGARRAGQHAHPHHDGARQRRAGCTARACPGGPTSTRWCTCSPATARSAATGVRCARGRLAVLGAGGHLRVDAATSQPQAEPELEVLVLGGLPIREPVAWAGPFVMNTRAEVMQAFEDFQAGRLGTIPSVHGAPTTLTEG
ncbi:hypothetical protein GCM10025868_45520 [Angustibacter aerolatus]|uniref:Pirin N-terminal domain-containing protein n=1 Tax=Angustibacter aerolatus TaxID=1162965 RepID=A0ABQ6JNI1_9ACTN|nr:pirin family protein [Angustibacter aerolatus]GMA89302.1 hypothetical protein GCM10025868_45520 [Angustibacter aerolatus]